MAHASLLLLAALLSMSEPAPAAFADVLAASLDERRAFRAETRQRLDEARARTDAVCRAQQVDDAMCRCFHHAASRVALGYRDFTGKVFRPPFDFSVPAGAAVPAMFARCAAREDGAPHPETVIRSPELAPLPEWRDARKFLAGKLHPTKACDEGLRAIHADVCAAQPSHRACVAFRAMVAFYELPEGKPFCDEAERADALGTVRELGRRHEARARALGRDAFERVDPADLPASRSVDAYYRLLFIDGFTEMMLVEAPAKPAFTEEAAVLKDNYRRLDEPAP